MSLHTLPLTSMALSPPPMNSRVDSYNARTRGTSYFDFKTATTGVAAKSMRNEISRLVSTIDDPATKKVRSLNMLMFYLINLHPGFRHRNAVLFLPLHSLSHRARSKH